MIRNLLLVLSVLLATSLALATTETVVAILGADYDIPAILTMPDSSTPAPAVLMIHGFGSDKNEVGNFYANLASRLAEQGYATLRFDYPGSGDHSAGFEVINMGTYVRDARAAFIWLAEHEGVDADRLGIIGFSMGGAIGSILAGQDDRVQALALWSAVGNLAGSQVGLYEQYYPTAREEGAVEVDLGWRTVNLSAEYFESRYSFFPFHDIRAYTGPLLIVHGEEDDTVPVIAAREFVENAGSFDITLRIIPGADHIFNVLSPDLTDSEQVLDLTTSWFAEKL